MRDAIELRKTVRVEVLPGDVSLPHLGLDDAAYSHRGGASPTLSILRPICVSMPRSTSCVKPTSRGRPCWSWPDLHQRW